MYEIKDGASLLVNNKQCSSSRFSCFMKQKHNVSMETDNENQPV